MLISVVMNSAAGIIPAACPACVQILMKLSVMTWRQCLLDKTCGRRISPTFREVWLGSPTPP